MGLFGNLTGTQHPDAVVTPLPAGEVRAALLVIKRPDVPYVMRNGTPAERADLVAEWRVLEPAWRTFFSRSLLSRTVKTRMRLDAESHEVRALDEQWEVTWVGVTLRPARSREYSRGRVPTVSRQWEVGRPSAQDGGVPLRPRADESPVAGRAPRRGVVLARSGVQAVNRPVIWVPTLRWGVRSAV
ncbi:hypothetical protein ACFC96_38185 [Streptomyces sp. NPDC055955]|uniref:hypothetical protein n=1 Tax=Streptomyces sp. NPDC055955 TaxID=3345665 RepID=UPI0035E2E09C